MPGPYFVTIPLAMALLGMIVGAGGRFTPGSSGARTRRCAPADGRRRERGGDDATRVLKAAVQRWRGRRWNGLRSARGPVPISFLRGDDERRSAASMTVPDTPLFSRPPLGTQRIPAPHGIIRRAPASHIHRRPRQRCTRPSTRVGIIAASFSSAATRAHTLRVLAPEVQES